MARQYGIVLIACFVLSIVQTSFLTELLGSAYNPNLLLAFAFALFLADQLELSLFSGLLGGFFLDISGFGIIGFTSVIYVLVLLVAYFIRRYIFKSFVLQLFVFVVFNLAIKYVTFSGKFNFLTATFPSTVITAVFLLVFYVLVHYMVLRQEKSEYKIN